MPPLKLPDLSLYAIEENEIHCAIYLQLLNDSQRSALIPFLLETGYAISYKGVHFYLEELSLRNIHINIPPDLVEVPTTTRKRWRYLIDTSNPSTLLSELGDVLDGLSSHRIAEIIRRCTLLGFKEIICLQGEKSFNQVDARLFSSKNDTEEKNRVSSQLREPIQVDRVSKTKHSMVRSDSFKDAANKPIEEVPIVEEVDDPMARLIKFANEA